jgi:hypothetical protein
MNLSNLAGEEDAKMNRLETSRHCSIGGYSFCEAAQNASFEVFGDINTGAVPD